MSDPVPQVPRRVLVTGAAGFIGRHVVAALRRRGDEVVALLRSGDLDDAAGLEIVRGDITDPDVVEGAVAGVDSVVHLAAATRTNDPAVARRVNVDATASLVDAAGRAGVRRVVAVSSVAVHRGRRSVYAATKRAMEDVVRGSGIDAVVIRPSLVYGPGGAGLFARIAGAVARTPVVPLVGSGRQTIRPVHVDDVVGAIVACLDLPDADGKAYDLVGPEDLTVEDLVRRIAQTLGVRRRTVHLPVWLVRAGVRALSRVKRDIPFSVDNVEGADEPTPVDPVPAQRDLGLPRVSLADGLARIADPPATGRSDPARIVVVGLGKMGLAHLALLAAIPDASVVGAVEVDRRLARAARRLGFRIPVFSALEGALEAVRPDGVVIATPTDTHATLARAAAARGVGVLVEKPLAADLASARAVAETLEEAGVPASCGYTLAYLPTFERTRDLLEAGALGRVSSFEASMEIGQVLGPKRGWMYDAVRSGGGVIPNVASHLLFLLHWYFGATESVRATTRSLHTVLDDEATLDLRFASGVAGRASASWSVPGRALSITRIEIRGENGVLRVDNERIELDLREPCAGLAAGTSVIREADLDRPASFDLGGEGYCRELEDFARALRERGEVRTSIGRALHVQAMIDAAYRSAASSAWTEPSERPAVTV